MVFVSMAQAPPKAGAKELLPPPKFNIAPENGWLEDSFFLGR